MRVLLHANGGPTVGAGHVVRCIALAEGARAAGHDVALTGVVEGDLLAGQLAGAGVEVVSSEAGRRWEPDVVHLDSYDESADLLSRWATDATLTSNIEDGAFGRRPEAALRVDPSPGRSRAELTSGHVLVAGLEYAPLRTAIASRRGSWRAGRGGAPRVLVMMGGGGDPAGLVDRVLGALVGTAVARVTVLTPRTPEVPRELHVRTLPGVDDVADLMRRHDLLVTAAGTSVWEASCVGIPMAVVQAAGNQAQGYAWLTDSGAALGLGTDPGDPASARQLAALVDDPELRERLAARAGGLVDGHGSWRVVRIWEQLASAAGHVPGTHRPVTVRLADEDDADLLRAWRNDPVTLASSRGSQPVSAEEHRAWLGSSLRRPDRVLQVGDDHAGPVGTVRWDAAATGVWEVSITVAPERRGQGLAERLLGAAEAELVRRHPDARQLLAVVHESNGASRQLFSRAGYLAHLPPDPAGFACYRRLLS